jgi:hypothetical protein
MSPKEKAQELVNKMLEQTHLKFYNNSNVAKLCALIAVDEIIKSNPCYESSDRGLNFSWQDNTYYWQEVKQFIEEI